MHHDRHDGPADAESNTRTEKESLHPQCAGRKRILPTDRTGSAAGQKVRTPGAEQSLIRAVGKQGGQGMAEGER